MMASETPSQVLTMNEATEGNLRFPKWLSVQAYKHDGLLHRQWSPAYLAEETEAYWALASKASIVTESDGRRWVTNEPAVFVLFKRKWMNAIAMFKPDGLAYYANVASPAIFDRGFLKYIDYDLDAKLLPDATIKELDAQEFERHALTYGYPPDLTAAIRKSLQEIKNLMQTKAFPFSESEIKRLYAKFIEENKPFSPQRDETTKKR